MMVGSCWRMNEKPMIAVDDARVEVDGHHQREEDSVIALLQSTTHTHYGHHTLGLVHRSAPITG